MTQPRRRSPVLASLLAALLLVGLLPAGTLAGTATTLTLSPAGTDTATYGDAATYSATLTVEGAATPVADASIRFEAVPSGGGATADLGSATTDAAGTATLAVNPVSVLGAGSWLVSAHWSGDTTWDADDSPDTALTVSKKTLVITPGAKTVAYHSDPPSYTFGVSGWELGESKLTAAGYADPTCTSAYTNTSPAGTPLSITCSGGAAANYAFNTSATATLTVTKADQTIAFTSTKPTNAKVGGPTYAPVVSASSGLTVVLSISTHAICALETDDSVSFKNPGDCTILANQGGNGNWNAAPQASQTFGVTGATTTTTTVSSSADPSSFGAGVSFTATISPSAATGSVQFTVDAVALGSPVAVAGGSATSISTSGLAVGNHVVQAAFTSDDPVNYANSIGTLAGGQDVEKADQTITFNTPPDRTFDESPITVSATASSGLTVAFSSLTTGVCTVAGTAVTFVATGDCTIRAAQGGNASYNAAPNVDRTFAITTGDQAITFGTLPGKTFDQSPVTVSATATSGLPVSFASQTPSVCTHGGANGATISFVTVGPCTIRASQAGDGDWNAATPVDRSFTISKGNQTVAFTSSIPGAATVGGPTYTPTATATSGLPASFSIDAAAIGICTIAGGVVSFVGAGTCVVDANQAGSTNWNAATQVQQSFAVGGGSSTTTLSSNHNPSVFGQSVTFSATVSGGGVTPTGTVTFRDGATVLGTGTLNGSGVATYTTGALSVASHSITASYGGNANYTASTSSVLSQSVGKASTTLGLASSDASSTYGQTVTLTATASIAAPGAGTASGTVQFGVDGINLVPVALTAGHASVTTSALAVGTHEVTAVYSGDGNLTGSSGTLTGGQAVVKATLTVTADPATREYGQVNPTFTAGISGFVNGETLETSGVGGTPACSSAATESSPVAGSPYSITCATGTLVAANYGFSYVDANLTVTPALSTVTLVSDHNPAVPNQAATLTATVTGLVTGLPTPGGSVQFQSWNGATWTLLDSQALTAGFSASTTLTLPATDGEYQYRAVFTSPDGNYSNGTGEIVQSVGRSPVTVSVAGSRSTWETNVPIVFTATITPDATNATVAITGSVDFTVDGGAVQTVAVTNGAAALPARTFTAAGVAHTITAAYRPDAPGSLSYLGATATPLTKTVVANTVSATGVGTSYSSIYPYRDSWRDTVSIRGTRTEPLSVVIAIYSPTGSKVRTKTYTRAAGAYAYTWNGRTTSGSMLASGKYKIVQTLADAYGARKSYTSYVTLSRKRMYWYTKTIYAAPGPRNYQMRSTSNTDPAKGPTLSSPSISSTTPLVMYDSTTTPAWIAVGYQFTLPSASTYTSVSFQVRHSATWTGATAPSIGLIPWNGGDWGSIYWGSSGTKSRTRTVMGTSTTTYYAQTRTNLTGIRSGRYVRAAIDSYTAPGGYTAGPFRYSFGAVKVVVKYGILK